MAVAILLSVLTFIATQFVDRFGVQEAQMLQNDSFTDDSEVWQQESDQLVEFNDDQLLIKNQPGKSQAVFQNVVVDTPAFYRFSYAVGVNDVVPASEENWALASISIIFRDEGGQRIGSRMITTLSGTQPSSTFTEDMLLTESVASVDFSARLYRAGGEFVVSDPVMSSLTELNSYKWLRLIIIAAWALLLGFILYTFVRAFSVWQILALSIMVIMALVGTMMPEAAMTAITQKLAGVLPESFLTPLRTLLSRLYGESSVAVVGTEVSKLGHFLVFMCFGLFAGLLWRRCGIYYAAAAIFVFAVVTEALQTLVHGRTTHISDLLLDNAGGLVGLAIGIGLAELIGLCRKSPQPQPQPGPEGLHFEQDYLEEENYTEDYYYESDRYRNR